MRHLGLEVHRLEKLMARQRGYSAAHQDADRQTGMHGYLLRYLYENQERDVFQRDIEKAFSISRSSVTVTLQLMEKNGLIRREAPRGARLGDRADKPGCTGFEADILAFIKLPWNLRGGAGSLSPRGKENAGKSAGRPCKAGHFYL
ncbi:MAG: MarR family transcriptional regulator [Ruminococcus callidus]